MKKIATIFLCLSALVVNAAHISPGYSVASASPYATRIGMKILKEGGNAFDAAVGVSAALAVTESYHSGLGGGGFWLLYDAKANKNVLIDGREVAPIASSKDMYLNEHGKALTDLSLFGALGAAIPGEPAALAHISKKYGSMPLGKVLSGAINLAKNGFLVDETFRDIISYPRVKKHILATPATYEIFAPKGITPKVGQRLYQKDLAKTLELLAKFGHKGFYEGKVAQQLVHEVRKAGGIWSMADLELYKVIEREPLVGMYQGTKIITTPPPSAGGLSLITMLNILSNYSFVNLDLAQKIHLMVEAMRLAYWDRVEYLGDPAFVKVPVKQLTSLSHAKMLNKFIKKDLATSSFDLSKKSPSFNDGSDNTTHFSIIDRKGNRVSATLSINYLFGSSFVAKGTGVLLNNEMNDFAIKPGTKNVFGLVGGESNSIAPKKRPLSSMAPTFLINPERIAILGTPGGSRIPTMLLLSTLDFIDGKSPLTFVTRPRFHHQYLPDVIEYENDAFDIRLKNKLIAMGYRLQRLNKDYGRRSYVYGDMQAIEWNKKNDSLIATSDPRHIGLAQVHYFHTKP